jgi:hypothetical protein
MPYREIYAYDLHRTPVGRCRLALFFFEPQSPAQRYFGWAFVGRIGSG